MGQGQGKYKLNQQLVSNICSNNKIEEQTFKQNIVFLNENQYQIVRFLGKGAFGIVIQAYSSKYGNVAIKIIRFEEDANELKKEKTSLEKINNQKYLTKTYEYLICVKSKTFYIVHELCDCTLEEILELNTLTESQIYSITKHLLEGLIELKELGVIHCDIKPENILYNSENNVFIYGKDQFDQLLLLYLYSQLIADFGLSKIIKPDQSHIASNSVNLVFKIINFDFIIIKKLIGGTFKYMAPEVCYQDQKKTNKVYLFVLLINDQIDIFSLGVTLAEIIRGEKFQGVQILEIKLDKISNHLPQNTVYQKFIDLILLKMIRQSYNDRMEPFQLQEILIKNFQFNESDLKLLKTKNKFTNIKNVKQNQILFYAQIKTIFNLQSQNRDIIQLSIEKPIKLINDMIEIYTYENLTKYKKYSSIKINLRQKKI